MYDGNGNVTALGDEASVLLGKYEYGPFGLLLSVDDSGLIEHPFRWSTKFAIPLTDLCYYGYRFYNLEMGRWQSRDPIEESGGFNLFLFVDNSPIDYTDILGLYKLNVPLEERYNQSVRGDTDAESVSLEATCSCVKERDGRRFAGTSI